MKLWIPIAAGVGLALWYTSRRRRPGRAGPHGETVEPVPSVIDDRGHARRTPEGYVLSGIFSPEHVPNIARQGVKLILGAVPLEEETLAELERHGIEWVGVPMHSTWRHGDAIRHHASRYRPDETMIHCEHGADRTGNIAAHLLVVRHGWPIDAALMAVVYPTDSQITALTYILEDYGYPPRPLPTGTYSLLPIGRSGGMKAAGEGYERLIRGNIEELINLGYS